MGPLAVAGLGLGAKALGSFFGGRAKKKQEKENKRAATAAANLQQKRGEDQRRGRVQLGASLLNGIPERGAGGVATNSKLDPAVLASLMQERSYDFGSAMPESKGGADAFLSGLFGDAADMAPMLYNPGAGAASAATSAGGGGGPATITLDDLMRIIGQGGKRSAPAPMGSSGFEDERGYY